MRDVKLRVSIRVVDEENFQEVLKENCDKVDKR